MPELTIGRMAKLYGLHRSTLYEAISRGRITAGLNGHGQRVLDLAEMIRVYGEAPTPSDTTSARGGKGLSDTPTASSESTEELVGLVKELLAVTRRQAEKIEALEQHMRRLPLMGSEADEDQAQVAPKPSTPSQAHDKHPFAREMAALKARKYEE
ncbi:helix-turn-helix domain-containing protein [Cobetia marina]|uniref:helix-turn-helix domain-containing protein n=1 Tax=Cobetia marina TaxID=28258 RepID=UPI0010AE4B38|nr:helix-turn-helix domain-containing protein [Cobetia marina]TKD59213.1 helix-turn-helix domain-containing protein [Cobetia marina]